MQRLRQLVSGVIIGAMLLVPGLPVSGQGTPEVTDADPRIQLAAVTPGADDLPLSYTFVGETFLSADQLSVAGFDADSLTAAGFLGQYVSVYENDDTDQRIRAYASLWADDAAATDGFAVLEDESLTNPDDALEDASADVGEEPRETTTGTYAGPDGETIGTADVTFRRGPMVIGIAHETLDGAPADAELAADLATRVDERAQAVLAGESLPHIDLALPGRVVSFESENNGLVQAGFLGPVEVETIYDVQGSLLSGVASSWIEANLIGSASMDAPLVTVGVTTFANDADAAFAAEQAGDIFLPMPQQETVDGVAIEGAETLSAFRYATSDDGDIDSFRIVFAAQGALTVIDVQQAASAEAAEESAMMIAAAQSTCLGGGTCEAPELPASLTGQ